jgi:hypothetical protein
MKDFNEKCAEYLGWDYHNGFWIRTGVTDVTQMRRTDELRFDFDWNWIILVLAAILEECNEEGDLEPYYIVTDAIPVLKDIKQAIYNYITDNE